VKPNTSSHTFAIGLSWLSRILIALGQFVLAREMFIYLGEARFVSYVAISGVLPWLAQLEFGFGSHLQTQIVQQIGSGVDRKTLQRTALGKFASASRFWVVFLMTIGWVFLLIFSPDKEKSQFAPLSLLVIALSSLGTIALSVGTKILYGLGSVIKASLLQLCSVLLSVICAFALRFSTSPGSPVVALILIPVASLIASVLFLFVFTGTANMQRDRSILSNVKGSAADFREAIPYAINTILSAAVLQIDLLVAARLLTGEALLQYMLLTRIFSAVMSLYSAGLSAAMPRLVVDAVAGNIKRFRQRLVAVVASGLLVVGGATICIVFCRNYIVAVMYPGSGIKLPLLLCLLFSALQVCRVFCDPLAISITTLGKVGVITNYLPIQAGLAISLAFVFARYWGGCGLLIGIILSFLGTALWILPSKLKRTLDEITAKACV
jgi:O-antigen/teichoic acid export membrane protein